MLLISEALLVLILGLKCKKTTAIAMDLDFLLFNMASVQDMPWYTALQRRLEVI